MTRSQDASDAALLARIQGGDREAFELFFRRHYATVFQFVLRMVRVRETADEVADDTMFAVWRTAGAFAGRSTVSTWLLGIAYRQALKALERQRRRPEDPVEAEVMAVVPDERTEIDPELQMSGRQSQALLQAAMAALSTDHRMVIELAALGHTAGEIGEIVDCPEATVRTRMFHARRQLKAFVGRSMTSLASSESSTDESTRASGVHDHATR